MNAISSTFHRTGETFCLKWIDCIRAALAAEGCELGDIHGTYSGVRTYFMQKDGERYRVTVEKCPVEEYRS